MLGELRSEIDRIDGDIVRLLNERAEKALLVGDVKKKDGLPISDENRERQVLERVTGMNSGPLSDGVVMEIYQRLIDACTELQKSAG